MGEARKAVLGVTPLLAGLVLAAVGVSTPTQADTYNFYFQKRGHRVVIEGAEDQAAKSAPQRQAPSSGTLRDPECGAEYDCTDIAPPEPATNRRSPNGAERR
jgi:hypothetical protein